MYPDVNSSRYVFVLPRKATQTGVLSRLDLADRILFDRKGME